MRERFAMATMLVVALGCSYEIPPTVPIEPDLDVRLRQSMAQWGIVPILPMPRQDPARVALGQALFFDPILSGNRDISCATCHHPTSHAGDGLSLAIGTGASEDAGGRTLGHGRQFVPRNAPTLLNQGLGAFWANWDGHVAGSHGTFQTPAGASLPSGLTNLLAAQALFPIANRREMRGEVGDRDVFGSENELAAIPDGRFTEIWAAVMRRLTAIPEYVDMFSAAYPVTPPAGFTAAHAANAIAAFQLETMTKTRSPFDRYLDRDDGALSIDAKNGAILFFGRARCGSCHAGPMLGAQSFANVGAPQIGPGMRRSPPLDLGRAEVEDVLFYRFAFRVPGLRNVELTAPYMHSGAYATLDAVVEHYADVPKALREYDVSQLDPALQPLHHGDETTIAQILATLDHRVRAPIDLSAEDRRLLVVFLRSLTDPDARELSSLVPASVPSGLPIRR